MENATTMSTSTQDLPVERGIIQSLHSRVSTIFQGGQDLFNEIKNLRLDLQCSGYPQWFIALLLNSKVVVIRKKRNQPLGSMSHSYAKGISES
jgi:hypothetical protein